jgi:hypothetical protein
MCSSYESQEVKRTQGLVFLPVFFVVFCHHSCGKTKTRGVSRCGLAIYIKKYLQAKKKALWKLKYFTMQKYNRQKNPLKDKIKILQDIITL